MSRLSRPRHLWFKTLIVTGAALALLLLVQTVATYRFVERSMIRDEARIEAGRQMDSVMRLARLTSSRDSGALTPILKELARDAPQKIDWIRIIDGSGHIIAASESVRNAPVWPPERLAEGGRRGGGGPAAGRGGRGGQNVIELGNVLVVLNPLRFGPPNRLQPRDLQQQPREFNQPPRREFLEVAVFLDGISPQFGPLRQNLIIGTSAAIALLAAVIIIGIRFPSYMKSKKVEGELALARRVQYDLFPASNSLVHKIDFAAQCIPALEVGGDLYDVFETEEGTITLALGDVSGKGLPAALLMGVVQGAVRASTHPQAADRLNQLLCLKTARERFVSMFWCTFSPDTRMLRYMNAGHLPPLLVRRGANGPEFKCLDQGGPVMGLLPNAVYSQYDVEVNDGDLLIVYSDGILEAANAQDEDFGEEGVRRCVVNHWNEQPHDICEAILADVKKHLGKGVSQDDQTLLIARLSGASRFIAEARA